MIYLATPYGHPDPKVREKRYLAACFMVAELLKQGPHVYSPIVHNHSLVTLGKLPTGWDFWAKYDGEFLRLCSDLWVVKFEGWEASIGIGAEIKLAHELGKPVKFIDPLILSER